MICNLASLQEYVPTEERPWNQQRLLHLYRRIGYSLHYGQINNQLQLNPQAVIDNLLEEAKKGTFVPKPAWGDWTNLDFVDFDDNQDKFYEWAPQWVVALQQGGLHQKMTLFWHNHFVTQYQAYNCAPAAYKYLDLLQRNALGNFRDFVHAIGRDAAMLIFLNGTQSTRIDPNENYARELYELFSLGRDNGYTQEDIEETSRALTGWVVYPCPTVTFIESLWDSGEKTIFGQTGHWGYDDVIRILFEEKSDLIAKNIVSKIYKQFVYQTPNEEIITALAQVFLDNDFEIFPVLQTLFKSEHFFDEAILGNHIKDPFEVQLNFVTEIGFPITEDAEAISTIGAVSTFLGQALFQPPNVAGWPGHRSWISSAHLRSRWEFITYYLGAIAEVNLEIFRDIAKTLSPSNNDPELVTRSIVDYMVPIGLNDFQEYDKAITIFKGDIPKNYYDEGRWNLDWDEVPYQVAFLMIHIFKLPEFQLS